MLVWTWGRWPDLLIDFSRDLYTSAQLAEGKVLYRDIAFFTGPLSPYLNALWLRLFGTSLRTLAVCNFVVLIGFLWLLYRTSREVGSRLAATATCLVFVTTFGLAHLVPMGNYNFLCPYSHDMVHGLVLGVGAVYCLARYARGHSSTLAWATGIQLGLVQLTRAELSMPVLVACCAGVALLAREPRLRQSWRLLLLRVLGPGVALPLLVFVILGTLMPWKTALHGVLGSWIWVFDPVVSGMALYRESTGLADTTGNLGRLVAWSLPYAVAVVPAAFFALRTRPEQRGRQAILIALATTAALVLVVGWRHTSPADLARPLPLFVALLGVVTLLALLRAPNESSQRARLIARLIFVILALGLLGKILLDTRFFHYGFVLAVPGTTLMVLALLDGIPEWIAKRAGCATAFRWTSLALLTGFVGIYLQLSGTCLARKTIPVGEGSNAFLADSRGNQVNAVLAFLAREIPPDKTLAVVPEGVMLNVLTQRKNPIACINLMPPELATLGEGNVLAELERTPPDVMVVDLDRIGQDGLRFMNEPYARSIAAWILANYELVARFESPPSDLMRLRLGVLRFRSASSI
ncbi:MAG TPA: glycosyltransferase family 39 protein [Polyangia bacterium]